MSVLSLIFQDDTDAGRDRIVKGLCIYLNEDPGDLVQEFIVSDWLYSVYMYCVHLRRTTAAFCQALKRQCFVNSAADSSVMLLQQT